MSKFILLTIFLLVSSAFAQRQDFSSKFHHYGRTQQLTVGDKADLLNFAKGFLTALSEASVFENIKACLSESQTFYKDITVAIADIKSKDPAKVKEGIALLGKAAQIIPTAAKDCKAAESEIQKLIKLAQAFTNPQSFFYSIGKSLLINHVEVIHEVTSAVSAYEKHDFFTFGYWVGKAMDTIFLGLNQPLRQGLVDFVNNNQNGWTAELPSKFANMTLAEIKAQFLGQIPDTTESETIFDYEGGDSNNDIPVNFNSSEHWPGCVHPIRDQGHCGSCWAFAASEVLSDRFCIASNKSINVVLSPQYLVSCSLLNQGCNGGYPLISWVFMVNEGLVTESCWPYQSGSGHPPGCMDFKHCWDSQPKKHYHAHNIVTLHNPTSIQKNILEHGPVEAAFNVYEDFMSYRGGIYKHTSGGLLGGHAVKIIGWGREGTTDYWIVANSWNTSWGEKGFFRIAFGQCGIDKSVTAGKADVSKAGISKAESWFQY